MNEQQTMLADMAGGLFAELGHGATFAGHWSRIEEMGFAGLLLPESAGGFGGTWADAGIVFRLAGYHALGLPLVEAVIASRLAADAGFGGTGLVTGAAWGRDAAYVAAPAPTGGTMLLATAGARVEEGASVAGEPRDRLHFADAPATLLDCDLFGLAAAARVMQMAGALDAALVMAVDYVNERKQFGKPLGKFQAVQQVLALFAGEAAATNCAAIEVARALDRGDARFEIAAPKSRANMAAGQCAAIAHQAHGAIGFTHEYGLHPLTRRLWSWRSEFGGEAHWTLALGTMVAGGGADAFWPDMVRRSDQAA